MATRSTVPIKGGYYIKARCIQNSWIAHSAPVVRETWDYLLREANHKERKYNGYIIKRGQLFRSYKEIREAIYWNVGNSRRTYSVGQMKHTMKLLANNNMIELANKPRGVMITICNYEYYQDPKNYEFTSELTVDLPADDPPIDQPLLPINKNVKNLKIKELKTLMADKDKDDKNREEIFNDSFWPVYPSRNGKRLGKAEALKEFLKLSEEDVPKVLESLSNYQGSRDVKSGIGIKDACRWIKKGSWRDWLTPEEQEEEKTTVDEDQWINNKIKDLENKGFLSK